MGGGGDKRQMDQGGIHHHGGGVNTDCCHCLVEYGWMCMYMLKWVQMWVSADGGECGWE